MMSRLWPEGQEGRSSISVETGDISLSHFARIVSGLLLTFCIGNGFSLPGRKLYPGSVPSVPSAPSVPSVPSVANHTPPSNAKV